MSTLVNPRAGATRWRATSDSTPAACMNCGVCTAVCPMGIEVLPRSLFRYVLLGMEEQMLEETESIYSCLLCKMCEVNCPAGVHIAENVRCPTPPHQPQGLRAVGGRTCRFQQATSSASWRTTSACAGRCCPSPRRSATRWAKGLDLPPRRGHRALHGDDVSAHPLHRGTGQGREAAWGLAAGQAHRSGPQDQPRRQREHLHGPALGKLRDRVRPGAHRRGPAAAGRPASSSATSTRTTCTPEPWPTTWAATRPWPSTPSRCTRSSRSTASRRVITIDPHTTNMLRSVYPKLIPGYDIQVKTYLEVLAEKGSARLQ